MDVLVNDELILHGTVGEDFFEVGFTSRDVITALAKLKGKAAVVRINSGGGIADEGVAIYNAIKNHKAGATVYVDGIAASAASIIAMAGKDIVMRKGAVMMVHDPLALARGNASDLAKAVEALNVMGDAMAEIYADKTGRPVAEVRKEMREEIWLGADEAVTKGYATKTDDESEAVEIMAFDYRAYNRAPDRIVALADQRSWSNRLARPHAKAVKREMDEMTKTPEEIAAEQTAAIKKETERAVAISTLCAQAGVVAMASRMINDNLTVEQATAQIEAEKTRMTAIRDRVAQARKVQPMIDAGLAEQLIAAGASVEAVATELLDRIAAVSDTKPQRTTHEQTMPDDQASVTAMWDKVVDKINARRFQTH